MTYTIEPLTLCRYIDIEQTIVEFGYDPRNLSKGSGKLVYPKCGECGAKRKARPMKEALRSKICVDCSAKKVYAKNVKFKRAIRRASYFANDEFWT